MGRLRSVSRTFIDGHSSKLSAMSFPLQDKERFERLRALKPVEAVKAFLEGDFGIGDEPAIIEAIQKDSRISLSDDEIMEALCDALDAETKPETCLEQMAQD